MYGIYVINNTVKGSEMDKEIVHRTYKNLQKIWNKDKNQKLSFNDMMEEFEDIELCTLNVGPGTD